MTRHLLLFHCHCRLFPTFEYVRMKVGQHFVESDLIIIRSYYHTTQKKWKSITWSHESMQSNSMISKSNFSFKKSCIDSKQCIKIFHFSIIYFNLYTARKIKIRNTWDVKLSQYFVGISCKHLNQCFSNFFERNLYSAKTKVLKDLRTH